MTNHKDHAEPEKPARAQGDAPDEQEHRVCPVPGRAEPGDREASDDSNLGADICRDPTTGKTYEGKTGISGETDEPAGEEEV